MDLQPLTACVATALRDNRVRFGDVRRLERALPAGSETIDALELLLALDRAVSRTDRAWAEFLVDRTRRLVVDAAAEQRWSTAERVIALIGERPTAAGMAIRADVARELRLTEPDLATRFAMPQQKPKRLARGPVKVPAMAFAAAPLVPDLADEECLPAPAEPQVSAATAAA